MYAIIDHGYGGGYGAPAIIAAYEIDADQIAVQKSIKLDPNDYPTGPYLGPVGLAIDPGSGYMFVTHDGKNRDSHLFLLPILTF